MNGRWNEIPPDRDVAEILCDVLEAFGYEQGIGHHVDFRAYLEGKEWSFRLTLLDAGDDSTGKRRRVLGPPPNVGWHECLISFRGDEGLL